MFRKDWNSFKTLKQISNKLNQCASVVYKHREVLVGIQHGVKVRARKKEEMGMEK